jgi:CelD/BcsL family acetyltransferase involved in cellulose biosynthesis
MTRVDSKLEGKAANIPTEFTIKRLDDFATIPHGYQSLFDQSEVTSFDLGLDWFRHLAATAIKPSTEAFLYIVLDVTNGQAVAALPVCRDQGGKRLFSLANYYTSLYAPLVQNDLAEHALGALFETILKEDECISIALSPMASDQPLFAITARSLRKMGWLAFDYFCFGNWFLPVEGRSYDQYFQDLPPRLRNTMNRKSKQFFGHAGGRLEVITGGASIEHAIEAYTRIYHSSWKKPEPFPDFIPGLIRLYAGKGQLRLGMAYINEQPVAAQIWLVSHGRAAIYKLAYDTNYANLSVGSILTNYLMQHVIDVDRVREIDYLIGDEPYKQDWMSQRRERWGIVAYNPRTLRGMAGAANEISRRAAKAVYRRIGHAFSAVKGVIKNLDSNQGNRHVDP